MFFYNQESRFSLSKKSFYISSIFFSAVILICYHAMRYLMSESEEQKTPALPGCEDFQYVYGKLDNNTRTVVLGEFHDYHHLPLQCAYSVISYLLYGNSTVDNTFFEGYDPDAESDCLLQGDEDQKLCSVARHCHSWEDKIAKGAVTELVYFSNIVELYDYLPKFQRSNNLSDARLYDRIKSGEKFVTEFSESFDLGYLNHTKLSVVKFAFRYLLESFTAVNDDFNQLIRVFEIIKKILAEQLDLKGMLKYMPYRWDETQYFKKLNRVRDESFFNQSVRTINQPGHLTLFIAGGAHADRLHRRIVDQGIQPEGLLIAGMKPITELHRNAMRARYDYFK